MKTLVKNVKDYTYTETFVVNCGKMFHIRILAGQLLYIEMYTESGLATIADHLDIPGVQSHIDGNISNLDDKQRLELMESDAEKMKEYVLKIYGA